MEAKESRNRRIVELALNGVILTPVAAEDLKGVWTRFQAAPRGFGTVREPWDEVFIQAPAEEAIIVYTKVFGHSPFTKKGNDVYGGAFELESPRDYAPEVVRGSILFIKAADILPSWKETQ